MDSVVSQMIRHLFPKDINHCQNRPRGDKEMAFSNQKIVEKKLRSVPPKAFQIF